MTATLEQTRTDLLRLIELVQKGEEIVIVSQGRALAKLTAVVPERPPPNRLAWLATLAELRRRVAAGKTGPTLEQILDEDRGE